MMLKLCGVAILGAISAMLLGELGFRGRRVLALFVSVALLLAVSDGIGEVMAAIGIIGGGDTVGRVVASATKVIFVGYLFGISADICAELGESGLASTLTLVGRIETFLLVLPEFVEMLRLGMELVS